MRGEVFTGGAGRLGLLKLDHQIGRRQLKLMGFSGREMGELFIDTLPLGPVALRVVVANERALDVAVLRAGDDILDTTVAPIEAGHGGKGADAFFAKVFIQKILAVHVGEVGVLAEAAKRGFGVSAALLAVGPGISGGAADFMIGGEDE
jgi:hypothetical protein